MADYNEPLINFNDAFRHVAPPDTGDLIDHIRWACLVLKVPSSEAAFSYSLMNHYATRLRLSERRVEAAKDMLERIYAAHDKNAGR